MYDSDFQFRMLRFREKERLREAEMIRLYRQSRPRQKSLSRSCRHFLDNTGKLLVFWGLVLHRRYGTAVK